MNSLSKIQQAVKAPKGQFNAFGKYKYRSCEDIVEAVKPVINPLGFYLTISDEVVFIGNRFYIKATATLSNGTETFTSTAYAREEETKKGMDGSQITGAASSYARKYALNGLFAIDDTKDADSTNDHSNGQDDKEQGPDEGEKALLRNLVHSSDLNEDEKEAAFTRIEQCNNYTEYQKIEHRLQDRQQPFDTIPNPSASDAKKIVRKISKIPA